MSLLTGDEVAAAGRLRITLEGAPVSPATGLHGAPRGGRGSDFRDFRPYRPGDDLRQLDWALYARHRRPFVRLCDETTDLPLQLLVDVSRSLGPRAARTVRRVAAFLAGVALQGGDPVLVFPFATGLVGELRMVHGRAGLPALEAALEAAETTRGTDLAKAAVDFTTRGLRPGLCVLITDLHDVDGEDGVGRALDVLTSSRSRPAWLRVVVVAEDLERILSRLRGEVRLQDADTSETLELEVTPQVRRAARLREADLRERIERLATRKGVHVLRIDPEQDMIDQLARWFPAGVLTP